MNGGTGNKVKEANEREGASNERAVFARLLGLRFAWPEIFQSLSAGDADWLIVGHCETEIACWTPLTKTARTEKSSSNTAKSAQYPGAIFPN